jgi:glutathione S-transferase
MNRMLDVATSAGATIARLMTGHAVGPLGRRPAQPVELYEFEACPYCRKVRDALSMLDLDALVRPCPRNGPRFREEVRRRGGRAMFPYLVDPNTGKELYESDDIVAYLFREYGAGEIPRLLRPGALTWVSSALASAWRPGFGASYVPARAPERPLELYSYEASAFSRLARERLCALEIPYWLHNVAKGSPRRAAFVQRSGKMMVPYLIDPNTGTELFESADIVRYLDETYALGDGGAGRTPPRPAPSRRAS